MTRTSSMSGPSDLVDRVEAALRSFGVMLVKAEPVNASAEDAASTASAAYLIAMAMLREVSSNRLRATYKGSVTRTRTVTSTFFFYFYTPCHFSHTRQSGGHGWYSTRTNLKHAEDRQERTRVPRGGGKKNRRR